MNPQTILVMMIIAALLVLIPWIIARNNLVDLSSQINNSIGTLKAQYQQRLDLIPDALSAARESVKAQRDYLEMMLQVRKGMHPNLNPEDLGPFPSDHRPTLPGHPAMTGRVSFESNPGMSMNAYPELQRILRDTEMDVSAARRFYWAAITEYNAKVRSIPACFVASVHGFKPFPDPQISQEEATKPNYRFHA